MKFKKLVRNEVYSFKLVTGEEVIGRVEEFNEEYVILHKPVILAQTNNGVGIIPYMVTIEDECTDLVFDSNSIISCGKTREEITDGYYRATSNIQIVR